MPSSYSASLRVTLPQPGELTNLWGTVQNVGIFALLDSAIAGWVTKALTGNYTLTTANGAADEARSAMLKFTGAGGYTVTIPSLSKSYLVWNACAAAIVITTGAGAAVALEPGDRKVVFTDGAQVYELAIGGLPLKQYIDSATLAATGSLPATTGNEGKGLFVRSGAWAPDRVQTADINDYGADQTARATALIRRARALAVAL